MKGFNMDTNLTVRFNCNNKITKPRQEWIDELLENDLALCQSDSTYNDNTIYDLLLGGCKGYINMTDAEIAQEVYNQLEHLYESEEV
jgi:hypothetical protein